MMMRHFIPAVFIFCAFSARLFAGEEIKLPITADNSIGCYASKDATEQENNMGRFSRIKMKGIENIMFFNFDTAPLKNKVVTKATLHIKAAEKNVMVRKVGFSTIATPWNEGNSPRDKKGAKGDSCYKTPDLESGKLWGGPDSCVLDAIWGRGGTIWTQSYVTHDNDMWFTMDFDGRLLEACAAGLSNGIAVSSDNGQVKSIHKDVFPDGNDDDNYFASREENSARPYFTAQVAQAPESQKQKIVVVVQPWLAGADLQTGGLEISWSGPSNEANAKELLGYRIKISVAGAEMTDLPRWAHPTLALPGEKARALLRFQPANAEVKVRVEIVGRGGMVVAFGEGNGKVSPVLIAPPKLALDAAKSANPSALPPSNAVAAVWAAPDCVKVNPITGNVQEEAGVNYEGDATGVYSQSNSVWSGKNKTVNLHSLRGEWVAYQVICQNNGKENVSYKIKPGALTQGNAKIAENEIKLSRLWYQKVGKNAGARSWYADPMLPLNSGEAFEIPDIKNAVPDQKNQTIYVEFFVPKNANPGVYTSALEITAGTNAPITLSINLTVGNAVIPDKEHFIWSMNTYSSPGRLYGAVDSADFINAERNFYTMSHLHRACLAVLHYSHQGRQHIKLPVIGKGKEMKVSDWSGFDNRFGPLFDASAFKGTPREGVPLDHFYLLLCEHYPMSMADGYKWNNATWEEHWKVAGSIEEGFSQDYKDAWIAVAKDHIKHFKEKGYNQTTFQVYLNDKYYHKQYAEHDGKKGPGGGVSFWLLDEPVHIDDFQAITFFGKLLRQAQEGNRQNVIFRVDISRPQWGRDTVDRVIDLNVTGGIFSFRSLLDDWRERYNQRVWTYGSTPSSTTSALDIIAKGLSLYSRGVDGYLPWQSLGDEKSWTKFEETCVFYTGKPMGIAGACASLRLKAYRRAEQDIEYVWLVADKLGLLKNDPNRRRIAELLNGAIKANRKLGTLDSQGAATESFSDLRAEDFEQLRQALATLLK